MTAEEARARLKELDDEAGRIRREQGWSDPNQRIATFGEDGEDDQIRVYADGYGGASLHSDYHDEREYDGEDEAIALAGALYDGEEEWDDEEDDADRAGLRDGSEYDQDR